MIKDEIRKIKKKQRNEMSEQEVIAKSEKISKQFLSSALYKKADTKILFGKMFADKKTVLLPVTKNDIITPVEITENTKYINGAYNISEPVDSAVYTGKKIDLIIIPGIAFDKKGRRAGFGKGCYDRFLQDVTATKVGYCYDFQIVDNIKTQEHDINMDFLVCESELICCE